jgi:WhiB family redox-sensing transcriptional regulator
MTQPTDWRTDGACRGEDPDLFFPTPGDTRGINAAKGICVGCPVRRACLADALAEENGRAKDNRFGIRGGKGPGQRYALYTAARKRERRSAA